MTRERAKELAPIIAAYGEGKEIQFKYSAETWLPADPPIWNEDVEYRIKPEPKKRPMTREEMLGFIANTPGIVVRTIGAQEVHGMWRRASDYISDEIVELDVQWATIDTRGTIGEPHAFETEE